MTERDLSEPLMMGQFERSYGPWARVWYLEVWGYTPDGWRYRNEWLTNLPPPV